MGKLVLLTADHGVMPTVKQAERAGERAGTLSMAEVAALAAKAVGPFSTAPEAVVVSHPFVFLRHQDEKQRQHMADAVQVALAQHPSVWAAWTAAQLAADRSPEAALMRNSWTPERGGDVTFVPRPFHKLVFVGEEAKAAGHATPWPYDRHVPAILWGMDVPPSRDHEPVAVLDVVGKAATRLGLAPTSAPVGQAREAR